QGERPASPPASVSRQTCCLSSWSCLYLPNNEHGRSRSAEKPAACRAVHAPAAAARARAYLVGARRGAARRFAVDEDERVGQVRAARRAAADLYRVRARIPEQRRDDKNGPRRRREAAELDFNHAGRAGGGDGKGRHLQPLRYLRDGIVV